MSHIVTIQTEVRDLQALRSACSQLGLPEPVHETVKLFTSEATGYAVRLPDWNYPVVCDLVAGQVHYDNFNGRWGEQRHLHRLLQRYAVEKTVLEARRRGHCVMERPLTDGSIQLTVQMEAAV
ncbi:MAG TPA: DUF1257 domain-containing protein [Planctomycetaceae bacterium]|nr:DUF1257 domain-containing protein [Planctomycetaceae bacterium]|tara:strand:+ start:544 stop:912 length:369 start_codon:yes stop_codon:yes gene_type:complete